MNDSQFNPDPNLALQPEQEAEQFPLLDYLQLLWFRKRLILVITVFVAVIGFIYVNQIPSVYTATATLMIGLPENRVVDIEAVLTRDMYSSEAQGEVEVLRSRGLAEKVINKLGLANSPEFNPRNREPEVGLFDFLVYLNPKTWIPDTWKQSIKEALGRETEVSKPSEEEIEQRVMAGITDRFLGSLNVKQLDFSNVINISYSSKNPQVAARMANALPDAYILDQLESKFEATEQANAWLMTQLEELETKVAESERAVEIYREEHGLSEVAGTGILEEQLSELNSQLIIARAERAEVVARLEQLKRLLAGEGTGVESYSEVVSSPLIQQLRVQQAEAMSRSSELAVEYGAKHPRMLQAQAEIADLEQRIQAEVEKVYISLQSEAEFTRTRVASLEASLREAQGETSEQNKEAIQLRALQREAAANRALFETFLNRFKETSTTQGMETTDARVISRAEVPRSPSYPDRKRLFTTIVLMGFAGACGLVLLLQFMNPGIFSPEQAQNLLNAYVIGLIPITPAKTEPVEYVLDQPNSGLVEAINSLKFSLALSDPDNPVQAVQVTSSVPEEGKTSLAIALARVVAASGKKVILLDADLRRSSIQKKLGLPTKRKGLSDFVVSPTDDISEFILRDEKGNLDVMPTGTAAYANATDIFSSHRMQSIIDHMKRNYDLVIVDTPPVMAVADARIIGRVVDKTIFVVRWEKTPRKVAKAAVEQLRRAQISLAGVVLQQVDLNRYGRVGYGDSGYYYHYGRYGKYYSG